ncbi:MAG TPA: secretin N-terminal domain-containing protein [Thermoanaerobaculia bacterium]|nr:secretin N-terminal domain-containing protein [Thermoanaerobaculia bacterium]
MRNVVFGALLLLLLGAAPAAVAAAPAANEKLTARSYQFKFRDASRAASVIKPLISASGSVSIQPSSNTLVVTDSPAVLREVTRAIQQYDAPPKAFTVELRLVAASTTKNPVPVPEELREISTKLSGVLRFNRFDMLGEIQTQGREGDPVLADLDGAYRADFTMGEFDPISQTLQLSEFRIMRVPEGGGELQQVFRNATLNLRVGQTVVLGASRLPDSNRILMVVLTAQ